MASLDKMEGDLIEGAVLVVLVILAVLAFGFFKSGSSIASALQKAWQAFLDMFRMNFNSSGGYGPASASLGSSSGWGASDEARYQDELLSAFNEGQMTLDQYQNFAAPVGGN
jgi:hypothetical protein